MRGRDLVDALLELSIVGSFSRIGYVLRRRLYEWDDPGRDALAGRTVLITGPTSGLGRASTDVLADLGARVVLVGRSRDRLGALRYELVQRHGVDRFATVVADMSSLESVRSAVAQVLATESRLDLLIDNAGAIHEERQVTEDGLEATFATMVAGPFVLTRGLLPLLDTNDGQVVNVVSGGMYAQPLPLDDLQYERGTFDGTRAYARAKRASTALMREWTRRHTGHVRFDAMHPGWADTPGLAKSLPGFYRLMRPILRSAAEGTDTISWLSTDDASDRVRGRLYLDRRGRPFDRIPATRLSADDRRRLWESIVSLTT